MGRRKERPVDNFLISLGSHWDPRALPLFQRDETPRLAVNKFRPQRITSGNHTNRKHVSFRIDVVAQ